MISAVVWQSCLPRWQQIGTLIKLSTDEPMVAQSFPRKCTSGARGTLESIIVNVLSLSWKAAN